MMEVIDMTIDNIIDKYLQEEENDNAKIAAADKKVSGLFARRTKTKKPTKKNSEEEAPKG